MVEDMNLLGVEEHTCGAGSTDVEKWSNMVKDMNLLGVEENTCGAGSTDVESSHHTSNPILRWESVENDDDNDLSLRVY